MTTRRFVTIKSPNRAEEIELELSGVKPISEWMADLLKTVNWFDISTAIPDKLGLRTEYGQFLSGNQTLNGAGVQNAEVLWLMDEETASTFDDIPISNEENIISGDSLASSETVLSNLPDAVLSQVKMPSLVSEAGYIFELSAASVTVGRSSKSFSPDIDLSELDTTFVASRRHAEIQASEGEYAIVANRTTNGTFVNGIEIEPGARRKLIKGDVLQFGFNSGVKLTFLTPS